MPLFSVIIPVYNTEKYLNKCIKSVIDQKHNKTEIILIEDCSTDSSLKVCNSFKNNPLVNIIRHKKNLGVSISRNDGILAAKGKYILFLDSDDWLYPGCLRNIEKLIINSMNVFGPIYGHSFFDEAVELLLADKVDFMPLVSHTYSLEQATEAFETASDANKSTKVLFSP